MLSARLPPGTVPSGSATDPEVCEPAVAGTVDDDARPSTDALVIPTVRTLMTANVRMGSFISVSRFSSSEPGRSARESTPAGRIEQIGLTRPQASSGEAAWTAAEAGAAAGAGRRNRSQDHSAPKASRIAPPDSVPTISASDEVPFFEASKAE